MRPMTHRSRTIPARRRGPFAGRRAAALAALALYAMLLQAFFAGLNAAERPLATFERASLCLSDLGASDGEPPASPFGRQGHDCVCLAGCHGGLAPAAWPAALAEEPARRAVSRVFPPRAPELRVAAAPPPARGPPCVDQSPFA